jgi:hypothetical protein
MPAPRQDRLSRPHLCQAPRRDDSRTASAAQVFIHIKPLVRREEALVELDWLDVEAAGPLGLITQDFVERAARILLTQKEIDRLGVAKLDEGERAHVRSVMRFRRPALSSDSAEPRRRCRQGRGASEAAVRCALARHTLIPRQAAPARHTEQSRGDLWFTDRRYRPEAGPAG